MEFVVEWNLFAWWLRIKSGQSFGFGCNLYVGVSGMLE
jgi:hypothetical protein